MFNTVKQAIKNPEIRTKILWSFLLIAVFRLGSCIPVPFIDRTMLESMFSSSEGMFDLFDLFSGGAFSQFTIFALGVGPYITASILIQLFTIGFPQLKERYEMDTNRKLQQKDTEKLGLAVALLQAAAYTFGLFRSVLGDIGIGKKIVIVLILVAAAEGLVLFAKVIDERGLGNGVSLIIFCSILSRIPTAVRTNVNRVTVGLTNWVSLAIFCIFALALTVGVVYVNEGERRIPVQYASRISGRKSYGGLNTHLPIKVNQGGVMPVIFAMSLLQTPSMIAGFFPDSNFNAFVQRNLTTGSTRGSIIYLILNALFIFFFTYFYNEISFNTGDIAQNLKDNGGFIPGIRPGKPTEELLKKTIRHLSFSGAAFLSIVSSVPILISTFTGIYSSFGGMSLIIAVSVALEISKNLSTQMVQRNYRAFLRG